MGPGNPLPPTVDPNKERCEAVKLKITKYLRRAEEIFNCHLQRTLGRGASPGTVRRCPPPVGPRAAGLGGRGVCRLPSPALLRLPLAHTLCGSFIFQHVVSHLQSSLSPSQRTRPSPRPRTRLTHRLACAHTPRLPGLFVFEWASVFGADTNTAVRTYTYMHTQMLSPDGFS